MLSATLCRCAMCRDLEELEQCILVLGQEPCGPEEPSISDSEVVSDGDDERYETAGSLLAARPVVWQKVKHRAKGGGNPQGALRVTEFTTY